MDILKVEQISEDSPSKNAEANNQGVLKEEFASLCRLNCLENYRLKKTLKNENFKLVTVYHELKVMSIGYTFHY